ncbi:MAG TPA: 16S rRNA (cytosine(967)-C(5))-methyltransferase RsmB [Usitatibacteraceae bacterium]
MIAIQAASAEVVSLVIGGKNLDRILETILARQKTFTSNERAAVHSISFDTLRHYGLLSAQLDMLLTATMSDAPVRYLLLVALAQLQFSKASAHAIVDHAVSAVETMGFARAKPLVNAVLRNYLRAPEKFQRERFKLDTAVYDFPRWWIERLRREQPGSWEQALLSSRRHPPMGLRVNLRKGSVDDYLGRLASVGFLAELRGGAAVELQKPVSVNDLPGFREGLVSVQDEGAQLAATLLGARVGMRVLDACAAPGGKTGHLLECADIELTALDSDKHRLRRVADNLSRLKLGATLKHANATDLDAWWDRKPYERILLDVPCSGSGVARRHPDIKWLRRETDLGSFARQQAHLLETLWNCLADGGRLLYVTCSVFRAENQEIIEKFLHTHVNARSIDPSVPARSEGCDKAATLELQDGQLLPDDHHDGFYYALLERAPAD